MTGGTIAAFVLYGAFLAGAFGTSPKSMATFFAQPAHRNDCPSCSTRSPTSRAPAKPVELPEPPQGALEFEHVDLPLSDAAARPRR